MNNLLAANGKRSFIFRRTLILNLRPKHMKIIVLFIPEKQSTHHFEPNKNYIKYLKSFYKKISNKHSNLLQTWTETPRWQGSSACWPCKAPRHRKPRRWTPGAGSRPRPLSRCRDDRCHGRKVAASWWVWCHLAERRAAPTRRFRSTKLGRPAEIIISSF